MKNKIALLLTFLIETHILCAQGTFQNLDFEQARLIPTGSGGPPLVVASSAIPGWTAYLGGSTPASGIFYDTIAIGSQMVSIHDSLSAISILKPLEGNYSIAIQSGSLGISAAISQTGRAPADAVSLIFYAVNFQHLQVTFAGNVIPLVQLGNTPRYAIVGGDISPYSGQAGELRFTHFRPPLTEAVGLDNIQFSTQPIPEPSVAGLVTLGAGLLVWLLRKRTRA